MSERIQQFDYEVNLKSALIWQYNNAVNLQSLINLKELWYETNQAGFWANWFTDVFNLQTANKFGLSVWSIILCLPLHITDTVLSSKTFGFGPFSNGNMNFNNGNFSSIDQTYNLTVDEQRLLLKLQYFKLSSRAAIPETNRFLKFAFDAYPGYTGQAYVLDSNQMSIRLILTQPIPARLLNLIQLYDLIPRGAGVGIKYINGYNTVFGFGPFSNGNLNFENGNFIPDDTLS